jgi:hypothetical protein
MDKTCESCGEQVSEVGYWLGPMYSHEAGDTQCLRIQLKSKAKAHKEIADAVREWMTLREEAKAASDDPQVRYADAQLFRVASGLLQVS